MKDETKRVRMSVGFNADFTECGAMLEGITNPIVRCVVPSSVSQETRARVAEAVQALAVLCLEAEVG